MSLKPVYIDPDNPSQLVEPRKGDTFINTPDLTVDTLSDLKGLDFETSHKRTETVSILGNGSKRDGGEARYYLLRDSVATINNVGGYAVGNGITMTVDAIPYDLFESDVIVFENGAEFVLNADASAGATSITGDLSVNSVVDGEKSNLKSDGFNIVTPTYTGYGGIGRWVRIPDRNKTADNIDTLINDVQTNGLQDGESIQVNGYYSRGDGGGGTFYWDSSEDKANHNGGTIINPDHNSTIGSANWYSATGDGTSTTGNGCWVRRDSDKVYAKWFGAKGDNSNNDTNAFQKASDTLSSEQLLVARNGIFLIDGITLNCNFHMEMGSWLKYNGSQNGAAIDVASTVDIGDIYIDGNSKDLRGVYFTANDSYARSIYVKNITASSTSSTSIYPVGFSANNVRVDEIILKDNENTGQSNGSFPQGVAVVGTSDGIDIGKIDQENGAACLVTGSNSGETTVGKIRAEALGDNGCYLLGGDISIDSVYYSGNEEGVVCSGAGKVEVGRITTYGNCITAASASNIGSADIGEIVIIPDSNGDTCSTAYNTRSSNISSGKITISSIKGEIKSSNILNADDGDVEYFTVLNVDLKQIYFGDGNPLSRWFDIRACKGFNLRNINIRIIDPNDTLTGSDQFISNVGSPTKGSFVHNFDVQTLQSDGVSVAPFSFRGNFSEQNVDVEGARWRTDIGPYAKEVSYGSRGSANVVPTSGYWKKGTVLFDDDLNEGEPAGWICISAGTPGTWKKFGKIYSDTIRSEDFYESVGNDSIVELTPLADTGTLFLMCGDGSGGAANGVSAVVQFRNFGTLITNVVSTGSSTDVNSGVPTGTTGTDGNFTVFFDSSNQKIYLENRRGNTVGIIMTVTGRNFS